MENLTKKIKPTGNVLSAFLSLPKATKFDAQEKGEEILLLMRRHWITNTWWVLASTALAIVPLFLFPPLFRGDFPAFSAKAVLLTVVLWYLLVIVFAFESFLDWYFNVAILTTKRVVDVDFSWPLYRNVSEAELDKIQDVGYVISGFGATIFNYGDILVQTASEITRFVFTAVPNVDKAHDIITDVVVAAGGEVKGSK